MYFLMLGWSKYRTLEVEGNFLIYRELIKVQPL